MTRKLRVFLCHASQDKPSVRELYKRLSAETWIDPWLDEESLLPGQDWNLEINRATQEADVVIICLSNVSVQKEGYLNREIRRVMDIAAEKLEGTIYNIPLRLDDCQPSFERLKQLHWVDYFMPNGYEKLLKALRVRAETLKIEATDKTSLSSEIDSTDVDLDLYRFIQIPRTEEVHYTFYIGKYPVTNAQYERFLNAPDFANPIYWLEFPMFDENCEHIGDSGNRGLNWLQEKTNRLNPRILLPSHWNDDFGIRNPKLPVVGISWYEANAYCEWLAQKWNSLLESKTNPMLTPLVIRLPLEMEWIAAAGGDEPESRYPWDEKGKETISLKEILKRCNVKESGIAHTTSVDSYPLGKSPFGVMDMAGNVSEWQMNFMNKELGALSLRGGSWYDGEGSARVSTCSSFRIFDRGKIAGFRLCLLVDEYDFLYDLSL